MSPEQFSIEELKKTSQDVHFSLREQLLQLMTKLEPLQKEFVNNQIATNMVGLFAYHKVLYEKENGALLNIEDPNQFQRFTKWRLDKVGEFGTDTFESEENDSYYLFKTDRERFRKLFKPLYPQDKYTNHWHIKIIEEREINLGDIHTDLTLGALISYFVPQKETKFYHGGIIPVGAEPTITIDKSGKFDVTKLI